MTTGRTENDRYCGDVLTPSLGRYLFSRYASACVTVDVKNMPTFRVAGVN